MFEFGQKFPCPCCGYRVFRLPPGSHGTCPICGWEDDLAQLRFPRMPGGANRVALLQAQHNFETNGAAGQGMSERVRAPRGDDLKDADWRPLEARRDYMEEPRRGVPYGASYPEDTTVLYYWRSSFWHSQLA